ncbi:MAG: hypothetical protein NC079_06820 [Clostridium sp.]|nr:hypothetical protein [Acetatifactor muris]MCM1526897.1 hypothetical protein [Bacteroides sp.]MCM1563309.1 hypothetical protein [Clostridium sp.]
MIEYTEENVTNYQRADQSFGTLRYPDTKGKVERHQGEDGRERKLNIGNATEQNLLEQQSKRQNELKAR